MREQWSEISENLKKMLHSGVFKVWIAPLQAQVHAGGLLLTAPNSFVASWLEGKMLATLREAAAPVLGLEPAAVEVRITAATDTHAQPAFAKPVADGQPQTTQTSTPMPGAAACAGSPAGSWRRAPAPVRSPAPRPLRARLPTAQAQDLRESYGEPTRTAAGP